MVQLSSGLPAAINATDLVNADVTDINRKLVRINAMSSQIIKRDRSESAAVGAAQENLSSSVLLFNNSKDPVMFIPAVDCAW